MTKVLLMSSGVLLVYMGLSNISKTDEIDKLMTRFTQKKPNGKKGKAKENYCGSCKPNYRVTDDDESNTDDDI